MWHLSSGRSGVEVNTGLYDKKTFILRRNVIRNFVEMTSEGILCEKGKFISESIGKYF